MAIDRYGVLKARPIAGRPGRGRTPHYHIHAVDRGEDYRVAVNVRSRAWPSELLYVVDERFDHPILEGLRKLPMGFCGQPPVPGGLNLDFIRGNLFERRHMQALPHDVPGPDNDLNELLDLWVGRALRDENALLFAFGERFGPDATPDPHFGFRPTTGMHRVHMNQGSVGEYVDADGPRQDGALLLWFPPVRAGGRTLLRERWVATFIAFQSQAWHTDDRSGQALPEHLPGPGEADAAGEAEPRGGDGRLRLVAAVVAGAGGPDQITIHNAGAAAIDLAGWQLVDFQGHREQLGSSMLEPGQSTVVTLTTVRLDRDGDVVLLIDPGGLKVDGVSYGRAQVERSGGRLVF
ncbi:MAG: DUF2278 family protein [Myxococcales bacterium]|nr:DUF2278 family protein [Myxococcales bacterium]